MRREFCKCLAFNFRFLSPRYRPEETLWLKRKRDRREEGSQGERGEVIARRWKKGHAKWRVGFTSYGNRRTGTGSGGGSGGGEDGSGGGSRRRWKWQRRWSSTLRSVWICGGYERGRERVQSGGMHLGRKGTTTSRSTRWWLGMRAQPLSAKRGCLWSRPLLLRPEIVSL